MPKKNKDRDDMDIPSIKKLQQERDEKARTKTNVFRIILNKCVDKITYTNRYTDKTYIIFEVPKVLIGHPGYDMNSCISYMIYKLSSCGYIVEFVEPFYLYIDWGSGIERQSKYKNYSSQSSQNKFKSETQAILEKFPNASKIEFIYEDTLKRGKKGNKK